MATKNGERVFETDDEAKTSRIISDFGFSSRIEAGKIAIPILEKDQIAAINQKLVQSGVGVYQIGKMESDLEKIFFDVISE